MSVILSSKDSKDQERNQSSTHNQSLLSGELGLLIGIVETGVLALVMVGRVAYLSHFACDCPVCPFSHFTLQVQGQLVAFVRL